MSKWAIFDCCGGRFRQRVWCLLDNVNHNLPDRLQAKPICDRHDAAIIGVSLAEMREMDQIHG